MLTPTESFLRKYFTAFGSVHDVQVLTYGKEEKLTKDTTSRREIWNGMAIVTFTDEASAFVVVAAPCHYYRGLTLACHMLPTQFRG